LKSASVLVHCFKKPFKFLKTAMKELSTRYNFKDIEDKWCQYWEGQKIFHAEANPKKEPYSIVIPPPNVTGILHMGHALNSTLQDIIIRYKRMRGFETLWMPGTDHAGIATQNVVEKQLAKEGKTRQELGREEFLKRLWDWKKQYGDTIIRQLKKLGSSCDWERTRFTMDEHYSNAVKYVFVELYQKGLIYQGQYIINWCPRCQTALSDEEAEHQETQGALYYIRYPLQEDPKQYVLVATTRPETMLGDTAVAVNPKDQRYKHLIGKTAILPILGRQIKIIADSFVDPQFGTGAVKVTPAHDPNDFEMGQRHHLEFINILHPDGRLNPQAGDFSGMDRFEAREALIKTLTELKLLEKVEPHLHSVGHCYRCDTVVEPYLSRQWFVRMAPLAKPAIDAVKDGKIKFHPARWKKVYLNWMENIRDWCISRQIWWGHRIPVWYCPECPVGENIIVALEPPQQCPKCHSKKLVQDEDVLDTWFSSWLWPFATLGWPQDKKMTGYFYPTASLFTASEIIFFWVARMIMAGFEFMKDIPFSDVYIHGTVRDAQGRKMSKSLGNAIDPLEIIRDYGADALRYSLIINSGQDLFISREKFEIGRNFANKIWNASRLILMNMTIPTRTFDLAREVEIKDLDLPSRWIVSRFYATRLKVESAIEKYNFSEAENLIYEFFWRNFCDWYLELIKNRFTDPNSQKVAFFLLENSLRLMHPFMPFVTEEIWSYLGISEKSLSLSEWPKVSKRLFDKKSEDDMQTLIEIVSSIRNLRTLWNIKLTEEIECYFIAAQKDDLSLVAENTAILTFLLKIKKLTMGQKMPALKDCATAVAGKIKMAIPLRGLIDIEKETQRINDQIAQQRNFCEGLSKRLKNKDFLSKAPKEIVEKDKLRLKEITVKIAELKETLKRFES